MRDWPADRDILVVGENDRKADGTWPGRDGAEAVARTLAGRLNRPVPVALPPDGAKDVRAWLTSPERESVPWAERGATLPARLAEGAAAPAAPPAPDGPPVVPLGPDEFRVNDAAAAALGAEPDLFQRGGALVTVQPVGPPAPDDAVRRPPAAPVIRGLKASAVRTRLTRAVRFVRVKLDGDGDPTAAPAHPPAWCVAGVHECGFRPGVRHLEAVVTHPVLLADGRVLSAPGYDAASGLRVCPPPGLVVDVPDRPTRDQVRAAAALLLDVVADFPFAGPEHPSAWLAGLLTPLVRGAFAGPAPFVLVTAHTPGTGKTLLVDVIGHLLTGDGFARMSWPGGKAELDKRVTALAIAGERLVCLDNLTGDVGGGAFDAVLTATRWHGRVLGESRNYDGPLAATWFGTGNNVRLVGDTPRRTLAVVLDTRHEQPDRRQDVRRPDLLGYVGANRGRLLSACLTIARGWHAAGQPRHGLAAWGGFAGWSGAVREAVAFAGLPDPALARPVLRAEADPDTRAMTAVVAGWERLDPDGRGLTTSGVVRTLQDVAADDWRGEMREALDELCEDRFSSHWLGYVLRRFKGRNFGGRTLVPGGTTAGANRWVVRRLGSGAGGRGDGATGDMPAAGLGSADTGRLYSEYADQQLPD